MKNIIETGVNEECRAENLFYVGRKVKITVLSIHFNELENKLQIIRSKEIIKITTGIENKFIIKEKQMKC